MADELWDEMRQANAGQFTMATTAGVVQLVPQSDFRVSLVISAPVTNPAWLSWDPNPAAGHGILLPAGGNSFRLNLPEHGRLLRGPIWVSTPAGVDSITVLEALHPCACMR